MTALEKRHAIRYLPATTCREMVGGYYLCAPTTSTDNLPIVPPFFAAQQNPKNG
jgi:hypothetical protein